jgi:cyanate permease
MVVGAAGFLLVAQPDLAAILVGALLVFGFGWSWPGLLIFAVVRVGRDRPATASSAVQAGGFAGGAAGPPLFGWLVVTWSYETGWFVAAGMMLVAAVLLLWARQIFLDDLVARPLD